MRRLDDGWSPADEGGRALLRRLARADPDAISRARRALVAPTAVHIGLDDVPTHGSFSPDGRQLLVATERGGRYSGCRVFELPGGTLVERHDYHGALPPVSVVHLGAAFLVVSRLAQTWELVRYSQGRPHVLYQSPRPLTAAAYPGASAGFVVLEQGGGRLRLGFRDAAGVALRDVALDHPPSPLDDARVAVDPGSGRLAVTGACLSIIRPDGAGVLARTRPPTGITAACFVGPDQVAAIDTTGQIRLYRLARRRLELRASVAGQGGEILAIPRRGEIAVRSGQRVRYLNAKTLAEERSDGADDQQDLAGRRGTVLWGSADGRCQALGGEHEDGRGFAHVIWGGHPRVIALADRPIGAMRPGDLSVAEVALRGPIAGVAARPFLHLLRECLRQRFAADVGVARLPADTEPAC